MTMQLELTIDTCQCTCGQLGCWSNQTAGKTVKDRAAKREAQYDAVPEPHEDRFISRNLPPARGGKPGRRGAQFKKHSVITAGNEFQFQEFQDESAQRASRSSAIWTAAELTELRLLASLPHRTSRDIQNFALRNGRTYYATRKKLGLIIRGKL